MNEIQTLNHAIFLQVNAALGSPRWLIDAAILIANDLIYGLPVLLFAMWLMGGNSRRGAALLAFAVAMLGLGANQVIGMLWPQPRPFVMGLGHTWAMHPPDASFPSDHLTLFTCVGLGLALGGRKLVGLATIAIGLLVGWARVFIGLHFPLDMGGSLVVAAASCALIAPLWRGAGQAVTRYAERLYRLALSRPIAWGLLRP